MLKFGLNTAILPDESYESVIDYMAGLGFVCAEVCCWPVGKAVRRYAGVTHLDVNNLTIKELEAKKKYAENRGIAISSLGYYPNALDANEEAALAAREHINKLIDVSADLGINMVTTFIGRDKSKNIEDNLALVAAAWEPIIRHAEDRKVRIGIENCPMYYTKDEFPGGSNLFASPYLWEEIFRLLPSDYLGINYDPSHLLLTGSDYVKPIYNYRDKIFHVHFKDIAILQDKADYYGRFLYPALWHSPRIPGMGDIDFGKMIAALNQIKYDGYAVIEVEDKSFEGSPEDVKRGIEQSCRYLRQYL